MKAAIYTRVSQDRSQQGKSVASQEQECRDVCARNGWDVTAIYSDNDRSASRYASKARPEFQKLMAELQNYDVLVTWEASRATRDLEVYVALRTACRQSGVKWSYSGKLYDFARPDDSFSTGLDMLISERESDTTRQRVLRGVRQTAVAGKPHGRVPFGYIREYDPSTGQLLRQIPHPEESPVITEGARRALTGESLYAIAKDFHARGLPLMGEKAWKANRLSRLLKNPTYAGKRVHQGKVIGEASWPALIPQEKWEALQAIITAPDRLQHRGTEPAWLLTGIARCGVCNGRMVRSHNGSNHSYICVENHCVARRMDPVDDFVTTLARRRLLQDDALTAIHQGATPDIAGAAQEVVELEARLESFYTQAADGSLSAQGLARIEAPLLVKLDAARARLGALSTPQRPTITDPQATAEQWESLPLVKRREVIRTLMSIKIMPVKTRGRRTFDPETVSIEWN